MGDRISFYVVFKGMATIWIFSILFIGIGCIFAFLLPVIVDESADLRIMLLTFKILGGIILVIGGTVFVLAIISLFIKIKFSENKDTFDWWINFIGGLMGAYSFALPSAFIYPLFLILPEDIKSIAQNTSIFLPIFTAVGIIVGVGTFFIARGQYRNRPRWK